MDSSSSSIQMEHSDVAGQVCLLLPMQRISTFWHCSGTFSCHFYRGVIWRLMHDAYFCTLFLELFVGSRSRLEVLFLWMIKLKKIYQMLADTLAVNVALPGFWSRDFVYTKALCFVYTQQRHILPDRTSIHTYMHAYMHTYTHTYIHTYGRTHIHTYIHTYIHTHMHTHIHTYIHTYLFCSTAGRFASIRALAVAVFKWLPPPALRQCSSHCLVVLLQN